MTPLYHSRPERWPQFSFLELLILVTLVALLMPWAIAEYRRIQETRFLYLLLQPNTPFIDIDESLIEYPSRPDSSQTIEISDPPTMP